MIIRDWDLVSVEEWFFQLEQLQQFSELNRDQMKQNVTRSRKPQLYEIGKSRIQGRGVFAKRRVRPGQKIIEYTGDIIPNDEADRRYDEENMTRHHTFLFTLDDDRCIDGNVKTNDARLINHSCDPNCEAIIEGDHIWI